MCLSNCDRRSCLIGKGQDSSQRNRQITYHILPGQYGAMSSTVQLHMLILCSVSMDIVSKRHKGGSLARVKGCQRILLQWTGWLQDNHSRQCIVFQSNQVDSAILLPHHLNHYWVGVLFCTPGKCIALRYAR